jgi:hypothetical protein
VTASKISKKQSAPSSIRKPSQHQGLKQHLMPLNKDFLPSGLLTQLPPVVDKSFAQAVNVYGKKSIEVNKELINGNSKQA